MATRLAREELLKNLADSGLFSPAEIDAALAGLVGPQADGEQALQALITSGKLTPFQAVAVVQRQFEQLHLGKYQVLDRLGAGGMGTVFKARHRSMKRIVAIKVLSRSVAESEQFVKRFQREVEAVAQLSHPNVVMAYDADEAEAGHFLVMEFVNGRDLASEVQKRGRLGVHEAIDCIVQAARGLEYAHGQGIIHRDIKPANLLHDVHGVVKVADLGLARINNQPGQATEGQSALTQAGSIMGTVDFMSPEQALGLTDIDHRCDIYSLGCTFYYLLLGRPPYQGQTYMAILLQHREGPIPSLSAARCDVPPSVDAVFRRMVAKRPQDRFATMAEVIAALQPLATAPLPPAKPPQPEPVSFTQTVDLSPAAIPASADKPATAATSVLLVEPSRAQQVIIRKYLQALGLSDVATAPNGAKALEMARQSPPRVVISALHLADMTGMQLAQKMWAEGPLASAGFVLVSSQTDVQEAELRSHGGKLVFLPKPFDQEHLRQAVAAVSGPAEQSVPPSGPAGKRRRVLVVDDSPAARRYIRSVLTGLGVSDIVEATDGREAMTLVEKGGFDLVVTDYNMPQVNGRELVEFLRTRSSAPAIPVIVVTTETDRAKLNAIRQLGVSAICDKSFDPDIVGAVLESLA
jgi:serine/threonine protein kinase